MRPMRFRPTRLLHEKYKISKEDCVILVWDEYSCTIDFDISIGIVTAFASNLLAVSPARLSFHS